MKRLVAVVLALVFLAIAPAFAERENDGERKGKNREHAARVERRENPRPPREERARQGIFPKERPGRPVARSEENPRGFGRKGESTRGQAEPIFQPERRREVRPSSERPSKRQTYERPSKPEQNPYQRYGSRRQTKQEKTGPWVRPSRRQSTTRGERGKGSIRDKGDRGNREVGTRGERGKEGKEVKKGERIRPREIGNRSERGGRIGQRGKGPREPRTVEARRNRENLRSNVRVFNSKRVEHGVVPRGARFVDRSRIGHLSARHRVIVRHFGYEPRHRYVFVPYHRRHPVVISYYYPHYYYGHSSWVGYHHGRYYRPVYYICGWSPGWIPLLAHHVYLSLDYIDYGGSIDYLDYNGLNNALNDIEDGWLDGRIELISDHLRGHVGVRIYFDRDYQYTTSTSDFYAMTADIMSTVEVTDMGLSDPVWISPREVYVAGWQEFIDPDSERQTKYISYRLRRIGPKWYIVAFGTSDEPIRCPYRDFRDL